MDLIRQKLLSPTHYFVVPSVLKNTQLPFDEMLIEGTTEYRTANILEAEYDILSLVYVLNGSHFLMRYGVDEDTFQQVEAFLESNGLNNVRKNLDGTYKTIDELDFTTFVGDEFMIIPMYMGLDVPKVIPEAVI